MAGSIQSVAGFADGAEGQLSGRQGSGGALAKPAAAGWVSLGLIVTDAAWSSTLFTLWMSSQPAFDGDELSKIGCAVMAAAGSIGIACWMGLYRPKCLARWSSLWGRLLAAWALAAALFTVGTLLLPAANDNLEWILAWIGSATASTGSRLLAHCQLRKWRRQGRLGERMAIVGTGPAVQRVLTTWDPFDPSNPYIVGLYQDGARQPLPFCLGYSVRGTVEDLVREGRELNVQSVLVDRGSGNLIEILNKLSILPVDIHICPDDVGLRFRDIRVARVGGVVVLNVLDQPLRHWKRVAKAAEDLLVGGLILLMIAPIMVAIAIAIKLDSPGPVFFRQRRYGYGNDLFEVFKFRTMRHDKSDEKGEQLTRRNDPRITRLGSFLRRTSLDELPQFINVLRGEMSIVGPRPHATAAKAGNQLYQDAVKYYGARHRVRPGITGWAQISGWRGETETVEQIRQRVEHDLYYIENWSIMLDLKIILRTVLVLFGSRQAF